MNNPQINPPPTIGRASVETLDLIRFLEGAEMGQVITYQEMNEAAKADVQIRNSILQTARRSLKKSRNMVFGTIAGIGIKRLTDEEIPDEATMHAKRARRIAAKGMRILGCADMDKLSPETKIKAITTRTVLGLFAASSSKKTINLAEQTARTTTQDFKIGDIAKLFSK
jgi:hypothetical protein